ncbi:hypothetical protein KVR01_007471 [Diaporthe batatas]|uniref:uncharacterized protein n=1 Tax=Diaporthe batatas TaxID=748121 RepID=UPI001D04A452|nr:uncharacterized protein KVR01_007471 [Diaporthe batatas]KAG8162993.1 hypothetical protein KVR01_007471 [Diaporthe batatas]
MVSLELMRASNSLVATSLSAGLVAVFVGATSGIGETTVKQFAKQAKQPQIFVLGRREHEGKRIQAEVESLNPSGEYHFVQADVSLLKNVDHACRQLRAREPAINLLFLTCGSLITKTQIDEGLHYPMALMYYARTRFIVNLLPQLKQAQSLRRVVTVAADSKEGDIITTDWQANNVGLLSFRPHATSMITLTLLAIARQAPSVSFVHEHPGFVNTGMSRELPGIIPAISKVVWAPVMAMLKIPIDKAGERHLYLATSARFPPRDLCDDGMSTSDDSGEILPLGKGVRTAVGASGSPSGGVYSVDCEAEGTSERVQRVLEGLEKDGTADKVWKHVQRVHTDHGKHSCLRVRC